VASLRELQVSFAATLRDSSAACEVLPLENLEIYRNNAAVAFRTALECSFPVLRKRVGDDYFRQLVMQYRERFPSHSGDLHWIGRDFSTFLADQLQGSDYVWLADLARLEWYREEASVTAAQAAISAEALARFTPEELGQLVFSLQSSLRLHASDFPVFTVWLTNQTENAPPVDQAKGAEQGLIRSRIDGPVIQMLETDIFACLSALAAGASLGQAVAVAGLDQDA
jgi:hypothetical protein